MPANLADLRASLDTATLGAEGPLLADLIAGAGLDQAARDAIADHAATLVQAVRDGAKPGLMEVFLAEYGLSTREGIALMCLAEALLRVPDAVTMDALIEDKIAPSDWGRHLGRSSSPLVNASTWALMLTGKVLDDREPGLAGHLQGALKRLGEPVIRAAVARAMKEMGRQFVLGETITAAMTRARRHEAEGYCYSYDMLGEAARTAADASRYAAAYSAAIAAIAEACNGSDIRANPGISVKLSALHPRYEVAQRSRVMAELVPRLTTLAREARAAGMGFNIDAEEADRLTLSLDVIGAVLADPGLSGWDGFGVVVQAYGRRAGLVIDWLHAAAERLDRRIMVRLVKGAYWDTEIKRAQVLGLTDFPVFTRKEATDVSYIANARKLLGMTGRIYPQFATHNAHSVASILHMASQMAIDLHSFEFQRLHGMGERLHDLVLKAQGTRCRIYAPVGAHRDLLAYLVRRLLENGANSSFVHRLMDDAVPAAAVAPCPFAALAPHLPHPENPALRRSADLFAPARANSAGFDLTDAPTLARIEAARAPYATAATDAGPLIAGPPAPEPPQPVLNPSRPHDIVGRIRAASRADAETALAAAHPWQEPPAGRAATLLRAADLYGTEFGPIFALLAREAGKTQADAVSELREAADFLRYYAGFAGEAPPLGIVACISPWNFPLAIFTGQIAAALAAGNAVIAKPAEQTPLIAHLAVTLLHRAGVPETALQLLPGDGPTVGARLTSDARIAGVVFTGSTDTARVIQRQMARHLAPGAPLIAETGGLNAMIVDSTALPEQAVRDVLASAFQSAGQRCSALRCLYLQQDVAPAIIGMIAGAMDDLVMGDPWHLATDIGPVIDAEAMETIRAHIATARREGRVIHDLTAPTDGNFVAPTMIRVNGIADLGREVFGPILHVATYRAADLPKIIEDINRTGYGLTFGLHTRIDDRVQAVVESIHAGNIYVNRNQIGAVVGSQPFGGEGLSGTGPKAGGPDYVARLTRRPAPAPASGSVPSPAPSPAPSPGRSPAPSPAPSDLAAVLSAGALARSPVQEETMPGPTGESNRLSLWPRPPILCLGPGQDAVQAQVAAVAALGGSAVACPALPDPGALAILPGLSAAIWWGDAATARRLAVELADRNGPILPLITGRPDRAHAFHERHLCIDTTASGGNAALLAGAATI